MKNTYTPTPVDTSDVKLPESLLSLREALAKNTHDIWAAARNRDGWTWGPVRDDHLLTHPDLIPYDELPEKEKEYDRITSTEAIKVILALGFTIIPPGK